MPSPRALVVSITLALVLAVVPVRAADEPVVNGPIITLGLFKNGLAVVERKIELPGAGTFRLDDAATPVHGTLWVLGGPAVTLSMTMREVEKPLEQGGVDLQSQLTGRSVTLRFREPNQPALTGQVVSLALPEGDRAWNRSYEQWRYYDSSGRSMPSPVSSQFLVLDTKSGRTFVDPSTIAMVMIDGEAGKVKVRQPVMLLSLAGAEKKPTSVTIRYLSKGISWAPSYTVNLNDDRTLWITQQAVVKNELSTFKDAEVRLISGFPAVRFAHVTSPLSLSTNWAQFFSQLSAEPQSARGAMSNVMQQRAAYNEPSVGIDMADAAALGTDGVDLHYQSIGTRSMGEGDSLALNVATGHGAYKRIVEWTVPDQRDVNGRWVEEYRRRENPERYQDAAWDAVLFKNPLPFPMTTAPATITSGLGGGAFLGQQMTSWVDKGEETTLRITKALSIRTMAAENEEEGGRELVRIGGHNYRKVNVKGELTIANHRGKDVDLVIRRQFSGNLLSADAEPKTTLQIEGIYSVNPRYELTWKLPIKAGQEQKLTYRYNVLVLD
ncbi:MAG: hypothetical protein WD042_11425 [Phycisphaeraceae bacterium]